MPLWRKFTLRRQKQHSALSSIFAHSLAFLEYFGSFGSGSSDPFFLGLTRPHHKVLHFLIGSSCSPVSTRATALPAFYFLAAANCLVLPIISAIELSDLLWLSVTFCHSCHSYHCYHSSGYSCCCGYSRFNLATPNTSLNPCRRASGSLRNSWDRVSLGFAGYLRLLPCLASSGYWFGLIKGLMPFTLRLMPFALLFTLSCLAREPNQDTPIKSSLKARTWLSPAKRYPLSFFGEKPTGSTCSHFSLLSRS